jgi:SIR2-like domain
MNIEQIIDFPSLQQLARSLWGEGASRGAAVLVGAGFSLNATRSGADTPEPPLWKDLAQELSSRLYPDPKKAPITDQLKIAEEFRGYFGQAALDDFIRGRICDTAWQPGPLHKALLGLPWADVLTTNWDTLIERAARSVDRFYATVLSPSDLASARSPRIIKLHGSIGTANPFIIAEEDYRSYPRKFAAFVNAARQVFIENELCLIGFSGDDPNFLQWSGWVRDNLGSSSRRIYLVGCLHLTPSQRKYLEGKNIAPIELSELVRERERGDAHSEALRAFFCFLAESSPNPRHNWKPIDSSEYPFAKQTWEEFQRQRTDADYGAKVLDQSALIWKSDREGYPGWLLCPLDWRKPLSSSIPQVPVAKAYLEKLPSGRSAEVLYELVWRSITSSLRIDASLVPLLAEIADPEFPQSITRSQQLQVAVALLRAARQANNDEEFIRWETIIVKYSDSGTDLFSELLYQRALRARDRIDYAALETLQEDLEGPDPIWKVRRAAILIELGRFGDGERLISEALSDLNNRQREDRNSLWILSRRAWVEWLAHALRRDNLIRQVNSRWPLEFKEARCDPSDELDRISRWTDEQVRERYEQDTGIIPMFEAGYYKASVQRKHTPDDEILNDLQMLAELVGLPRRLRNFDIVSKTGRDAIELAFRPNTQFFLWFLRASDRASDSSFERYFSRIAVALIPTEVAALLRDRILSAIDYWKSALSKLPAIGPERGFAIARLSLFIEALARLTVRQETAIALENFSLAMRLGQDPLLRDEQLFTPISNLAKFSIQAVPLKERPQLVLQALEFPLSTEAEIDPSDARNWPNPVQLLYGTKPTRSDSDLAWKKRILALVEASSAQGTARHEAIFRLTYLAKYAVLTEAEKAAFGSVLWSQKDSGKPPLPADTGLLSFQFAKLPSPGDVDATGNVLTRLFEIEIPQIWNPILKNNKPAMRDTESLFQSISFAGPESVTPTSEQAARAFDRLVSWRPARVEEPLSTIPFISGYLDLKRSSTVSWLGEALAQTIVPSLATAGRTEKRAEALIELIQKGEVHAAIEALPYFAVSKNAILDQIVDIVRQSVASSRFEEVASGAIAVLTWATVDEAQKLQPLPEQLVGQMMSAIAFRQQIGLAALLNTSLELLKLNRLGESDKTLLCRRLDELFVETDYKNVMPASREAVSVSLVRANCVRLARALQTAGCNETILSAWLDVGAGDPLPEVRFCAYPIA